MRTASAARACIMASRDSNCVSEELPAVVILPQSTGAAEGAAACGQNAGQPCTLEVYGQWIGCMFDEVGWRFRLLKGKSRTWLGVAVAAAAMCVSGAAASGQVQSPPPGVVVPPSAPLAGVRYDYP